MNEDTFFESLVSGSGKSNSPKTIEMVYFTFFERGIDLYRFNQLPIPYILSIMSTLKYKMNQEEKERKKAAKKK